MNGKRRIIGGGRKDVSYWGRGWDTCGRRVRSFNWFLVKGMIRVCLIIVGIGYRFKVVIFLFYCIEVAIECLH